MGKEEWVDRAAGIRETCSQMMEMMEFLMKFSVK